MRQRMMILAAFTAAAFAFSAQAGEPLQTPAVKTAAVTTVAGGLRAPTVVNGCGSCAANNSAFTVHNRHLGIGGGTVNPVGCGCWASEKTFLWGGCRQFFNPQHSCGRGCGGERNPCALPTYGPGYGAPANSCAGPFTYMNR